MFDHFFLQPRFAYKVGDGVCDPILNNAECCYDGNDCKTFASECSQCPRNFLRILRVHKGKCLPSFNTPQCCYSLGACSNINECHYSAKLPLVQNYIQVCAYCIHCCMKCPQILKEKTSSQKYTVIALRIQWKVSAEGITLNYHKCHCF